MALEQVFAERDSEDEVDDDVADLEDRRVCPFAYIIFMPLLSLLNLYYVCSNKIPNQIANIKFHVH